MPLGSDTDLPADTRCVMTLGPRFKGSVVAASILHTIQGDLLPLPHRRLAPAAAAMPAVHELLPQFPCPEEGTDVRHLTPADVAELDGDKDLFEAPQDFFTTLHAQDLPHHRPVVGIRRDTVQSMKPVNGIVHASGYCFRTGTDGEVKRRT